MAKRTTSDISITLGEKTLGHFNDLGMALTRLAEAAEDSYDFEELLDNAMCALYQAQPNGQQNYGGENPAVGTVGLNRSQQEVHLQYSPAGQYAVRWRYTSCDIGKIDLRKRTYSPKWGRNRDEDFLQIPEVLMKDTEKVMEYLGLKREEKPETKQYQGKAKKGK